MGTAYWLVPKLVGKELELGLLAKVQPYLWFVGMAFFSFSNHITGLMGMPRRIYESSYGGSAVAAEWEGLTLVSAFGGLMLYLSSFFFILVMLGTVLAGKKHKRHTIEFAEPLEGAPVATGLFDRIGLWVVVAIVFVIVAYAYPLIQHFQLERFGSPPFPVY
jgi:cytochrome c oxidase subunit 1